MAEVRRGGAQGAGTDVSMRRRYRKLMRLPLFRGAARDVDEEFSYHLQQRVQELVRAGYDPHSAQTEALRRFGDVADARAYCTQEQQQRLTSMSRTLFLDGLRQDIVLSWRHLRREPGFAFSAIVVLAASIAIATASYGVAHAYLVRPLPYPEPDRLVQIIAGPSRQPLIRPPSLAAVEWPSVDSIFAETVAWDLDGFTLPDDRRPEYVDGAWVSPGYFAALGMRPTLGRGFTAEEYRGGAAVALISDALWERRFNRDPSIIGRAIRAHSTDRPRDLELVTVVGVMSADVWHVSGFTDMLRPLVGPRMPSLAKLREGMSISEAQRQLNATVLPQLGAGADPAWHMSLVSVQDEYTFEFRPVLIALVGAAAFLLLVGCASVAGAHAAHAVARRPELRIRMALGASRRRIFAQLLTEHLVIAACAAVLGVAAGNVVLQGIGALVAASLRAPVPGGPERLALDASVLAITLFSGVAIGVAFGLLPAMLSSRVGGAGLGAERGLVGRGGVRSARRALMVSQVAVTMMLLVGAGLMVRTLGALAAEPLGFEDEGIVKSTLMFPLGRYPDAAARVAGADKVLSALVADGRVAQAAIAAPHPFRGQMPPLAVVAEAQRGTAAPEQRIIQYVASPGFFDVLGIRLLDGRAFGPLDDLRSTPVVLIGNQLAQRLWPAERPLGRRIRTASDTVWRTVVGIVADIREVSTGEQLPEVYLPYSQVPRAYVSIVMGSRQSTDAVIASAAGIVAGVDDVLALSQTEALADVVERDGSRRRGLTAILVMFALLALSLAVVGLYSSLAHLVASRRREIAIRMAVGSRQGDIVRLVLGEAVPIVTAGIAAGVVLSLALARFIGSQLYGVSRTDPPTFAAIALIIAVAAIAAAALPVTRALQVEPAALLRGD